MSDAARHRLRATFGSDAISYNRYRPGYPAPLFGDLARVAGLQAGSRVLEIGPGTGQATVPLAALGVRLIEAAFEDWPLPVEPFDLVFSATAFHWIDPGVRMQKCARALSAGGTLAVISTHHVRDSEPGFFDDVQACYRRFDPDTPPGFRLPRAVDVPQDPSEFADSGLFGPVTFHRYEWDHEYNSGDYVNLLATYSDNRARPAAERSGLFRCVRQLIDGNFGGRISMRYLTQLAVARRS